MSQHRVLIYILRRDLRLADNPIFHEVAKLSQQSQRPFTHVLPVYVFPAQQVEVAGFLSSPDDQSPYPEARSQVGGFWRCGPHRARFLAESVWDLKTDLEKVGSGLAIRIGMVGQVVRDLLEGFRQDNVEVTSVWMTSEEGVEEQREERDVRGAAKSHGTDFKLWVDEKYFIDEYVLILVYPRLSTDSNTAVIFHFKSHQSCQMCLQPSENKSNPCVMGLVDHYLLHQIWLLFHHRSLDNRHLSTHQHLSNRRLIHFSPL